MKKIISVVAGVLFLLFALTITGAVAFYSNNDNCQSCHEMKKDYNSWRISSHSSVSCTMCHYRDASEGTVSLRGTALGRIIDHFLKAKKNPKAYVSKANCLQCHASIKKSIKTSRKSHVINPHPIHLAAGFICVQCHENVVHATNISTPTRPQMKNCINCHRRKDISTECNSCHFGTQEHVDKIAQAGGYTLKDGESCDVCHTEKHVNKTDHGKALAHVGGFNGPETCTKCHVNAIKQVLTGVHSRLKTKVAHVPGLQAEMGMAVKAGKPFMWAYQIPKKDGTNKSGGCGQCHVGGSDLPTPVMASSIDCLICHAEKYDMSKRQVIKSGDTAKWVGDTRQEAAASVGKPKARYCWRCHQEHMEDLRGTPYTPDADVHARAGMSCQSCHITINHKVAKGSVADLTANDIPEVAVTCTSCHVDYKHDRENIDVHLGRFACQTCHIGRGEGLIVWDKTRGTDPDKDGAFDDTKVKGHDISPSFYWFNGTADEKGMPVGSRNDKKAKIYPFNVIKLIMAVNPETKQPVGGDPFVFTSSGDYGTAVKALAQSLNVPEPAWVSYQALKIEQMDHAIKRNGLGCDDCHARNGIMNFKALGYTDKEVEELSRPKN